jgi:hypothetical protein
MRTVGAALDEFVARAARGAGSAPTSTPSGSTSPPGAVGSAPRDTGPAQGFRDARRVGLLDRERPGGAHAITLLDDSLEGLLELVDLADSDDVIDLNAAVILPTNPSTPLPAYRLAVDLDL